MREIKFRGYSVDELTGGTNWLYGFGAKDIDYVDGTIEWHLHTLNGTYEVVPESIGQYTGLKDKNGKEIYEGDVYQYNVQLHLGSFTKEYNHREVVKFEDGAFWVSNYLLWEALEGDNESEIIGNIYENPELLEGETNV